MDAVLNILNNLGVDLTALVQLGIFTVTFIPLYLLVFKPYHDAYLLRLEKTKGSEESSEKLLADSESLQAELKAKTIEINEAYQAIYDSNRKEAQQEHDKLVGAAREKTKTLLETTRDNIAKEIQTAKVELEKQTPLIKEQIVEKMIR